MCPVRSGLKNWSLMSPEVKGDRTAIRKPLSGFQAEEGIGLYCLVPEDSPQLVLRGGGTGPSKNQMLLAR